MELVIKAYKKYCGLLNMLLPMAGNTRCTLRKKSDVAMKVEKAGVNHAH